MQTRTILVTAGARLIDYKAKSYKGTVDDFIEDVNRLNKVASYLIIWNPGKQLVIPLVKGAEL